jgi:hypothetical protein
MPRTIAHKKKDPRSTKERQDDFLIAFEELANIKGACKKSNVPRRTFYEWLEKDIFKKKYERSEKIAISVLEDEAYRRAVEGTDKPVFQGGVKVGTIKEYSDTLLIVLLKARQPEKYKERSTQEITGKDGKDIGAPIINIQSFTPDVPVANSINEDE